jgi:CRP-like cAMP-binding protein
MALKPFVYQPGEVIIRKGEMGRALYIISRGEVEVLDDAGEVVATLGEGAYFGEISLLLSEPRTATVRASQYCDLYQLDKSDFTRVLRDRPQFLKSITETATTRYNVTLKAENLLEEE